MDERIKNHEIEIVCIKQPSLTRAHIGGDNGDFVFIICNQYAEFVAGKKFDIKRPFLAKARFEFIKYLDEKEPESGQTK